MLVLDSEKASPVPTSCGLGFCTGTGLLEVPVGRYPTGAGGFEPNRRVAVLRESLQALRTGFPKMPPFRPLIERNSLPGTVPAGQVPNPFIGERP